jgi:tetratricopeptide (TPR) repeat protein
MRPLFRHATLTTALLFVAYTVHAKTANEIYEQAARSTVVVENIDDKGTVHSRGSGVVLADGYVVTNCHVVKGASQLKVRVGAKVHSATLRYSDWDRDVCSLSIAGLGASAVVVGSTKTLKVGAKVYAIGAPKGLELTLSDGIVSSLREVEGGHYIQTTAAISPGSSGGGLFDENGELVGLTTFYYTEGQNLNFAVPIEWVKDLAQRSTKASTDAQPVTQWLNKAIELERRKDWPAMLEHSNRWTKAQPGNSAAWCIFGIAYDNAGQSSKAIEAYQQALRINPEYADAWNNLGNRYDDAGQSGKAIESYQQALRINPDHAFAWNNLGVTYRNAGQPAKAIEALQQALRINPEYAEAWNTLGSVYSDKAGQSAKAIESYQQALRINPDHAMAWSNLGNVYDDVGQFAKAIEAYQQALRIKPDHANTWNNLGVAYRSTNQTAKAIEAYQQALRINPKHANAWFNLGIVYSESGQRDKVPEVYKRLKTLDPARAERFFKAAVIP